MSMINCEVCGNPIDTDFKEIYKLDDLNVCENCYEKEVNKARLEK